MLERRKLPGGVTALVSTGLESDGFLAAFTERTGGVSTGPYRSLNLGLRSGDEPGPVRRNRRKACDALALRPFACAEQVHGARVARIGPSQVAAGFEDAEAAVPGADALFSTARGVALAVFTADCVPVALADPRERRLAVVHAGWRGVAAGILGRALQGFSDPGVIRAAIGPGVGIDHYEVGEDVAAAVSRACEAGAVIRRGVPRPFLDLPGTVARILKELGVRSAELAGECTACERRRFFSHRRDGETGRQALVAARLE